MEDEIILKVLKSLVAPKKKKVMPKSTKVYPLGEIKKNETLQEKVKPREKEDTIDDEIDGISLSEEKDNTIDMYMNLFSQNNLYHSSGNSSHEYTKEIISSYLGYLRVSNVKQNYELVHQQQNLDLKEKEAYQMDSEEIRKLAITISVNAAEGHWMYNDISMEDHDRFNNWMNDRANKHQYEITMSLIGIGQMNVMPRMEMKDGPGHGGP